jgi:hypothetical protein
MSGSQDFLRSHSRREGKGRHLSFPRVQPATDRTDNASIITFVDGKRIREPAGLPTFLFCHRAGVSNEMRQALLLRHPAQFRGMN